MFSQKNTPDSVESSGLATHPFEMTTERTAQEDSFNDTTNARLLKRDRREERVEEEDRLRTACRRDEVELLRLYAFFGLRTEALVDGGYRLVFEACMNKSCRCLYVLLSLNAKTQSKNETALFAAAASGSLHCADLLLRRGVDVNRKRAHDGATALVLACQNGHKRCVDMLLTAGATADIQVRAPFAFSPLYVASQNGHYDIVRALLRNGADANVTTHASRASPLFIASQNGNEDCVRVLLAHGADAFSARCERRPRLSVNVALLGKHDSIASLLYDVMFSSALYLPHINADVAVQECTLFAERVARARRDAKDRPRHAIIENVRHLCAYERCCAFALCSADSVLPTSVLRSILAYTPLCWFRLARRDDARASWTSWIARLR